MQKRFSLCAVSFPVIFAALIASAPVSGEENENASSPRQDITMDTADKYAALPELAAISFGCVTAKC